jgi:serine/threonine protein kinase
MQVSAVRAAAEDAVLPFALQDYLGRGSYGCVFLGRDDAGATFAVKVLPFAEGDETGWESVRSEVATMQQCAHANIVRYLSSTLASSHLWILMEYCGGGSIRDVLNARGSPLAEEQIAFVCRESLQGLAYLHSLAKVHRDIKCSNILLTERGEVKLADFGVAVQLTRTMSKRNTFVGTPHWMAPEVIQESRYDGKVDVWALGISALEMAEFQPPRHAVHPMRVIFMISRDAPPALAEPEAWSHAMGAFVTQCLQKVARARPTAAEALRHPFIESASVSSDCMAADVGGTRRWLEAQRARATEAAAAEPAPPPPGAAPAETSPAGGSAGSASSLDAHELSSEEARSPMHAIPARPARHATGWTRHRRLR